MKRIALLSCCLLAVLFLASTRSASAEPGQANATIDFQALTAGSSAAPSAPMTPAKPQALPSDPVEGRTDAICFWRPTGVCCGGGFQIEEWACDPDLTRCGPRTC
jgi:hypothetical protein